MTKPKPRIPQQQPAQMPQKFAALFKWHIVNGTRPETGIERGEEWRSNQLAKAIRCNAASIRNWRKGRSLPVARYIDSLCNVFFGSTPSLQEWRTLFFESWERACFEQRYQILHRDFLKAAAQNDEAMPIDEKNREAVRELSSTFRKSGGET
jgi:hypothetical protein